jgi:hypothetical protein
VRLRHAQGRITKPPPDPSAQTCKPVRTSSGSWSYAVEPTQSLRSQLKASGSFNPAASHAAPRGSPAASPAVAAGAAGSGSPAGAAAAGGAARRPCAPVRLPTAVANKGAAGGAAAGGRPHGHADDDDEVGWV